jgi:ATP-dependent DNA ligase
VRSCFIDDEAVVVDERGLSTFELLRSWRHDHAAVLCILDMIELDGKDFTLAAHRNPQAGFGQSAVPRAFL